MLGERIDSQALTGSSQRILPVLGIPETARDGRNRRQFGLEITFGESCPPLARAVQSEAHTPRGACQLLRTVLKTVPTFSGDCYGEGEWEFKCLNLLMKVTRYELRSDRRVATVNRRVAGSSPARGANSLATLGRWLPVLSSGSRRASLRSPRAGPSPARGAKILNKRGYFQGRRLLLCVALPFSSPF